MSSPLQHTSPSILSTSLLTSSRGYYYAPVVAAALVLAVFLSSFLDFSAFSPPVSTPSRRAADTRTAVDTLGSRPAEAFTDLLGAYARWDAAVGCPRFEAKFSSWSPDPKAVQDPEAAPCSALRLAHVGVAVKRVSWVPDILDGVYMCRCGMTCVWNRNEEAMADKPDVVLYESWHPPGTRKPGEPLRAFMDIEATRKPSGHEDIFLGYHAADDVQVTYAGKFFRITHSYHLASKKRDDILVYWSSSRCFPHRNDIAREFFKHIPAHSFGRCENNVGGADKALDFYPDCNMTENPHPQWWDHLHCAMSHYKFVLAIENTITASYVTEKLYYALDAGSVPIYFGAPNVWDLVPPNSIVDGSKFDSLVELADYVKRVANDPLAYAEFHAWRRCGVLGNYGKNRLASLDTLPCRLCEFASGRGGRNAPNVTSS